MAANPDTEFFGKYGPWALVTGAGRGLGEEFARQLAAMQFKLVLIDIDTALLESVAEKIETEYKVEVRCIILDLSTEGFLDHIIAVTRDIDIGLLVNHAGLSSISHFFSQSRESIVKQMDVNVRAPMLLTWHFAHAMKRRRRGGIIITSSAAAELPSGYNATYSATKAFDLRLAESLWYELKPAGIDVLGWMPAGTNTPGMIEQGLKSTEGLDDVESTVGDAIRFLGKRPSIVAGTKNRIIHHGLLTLVPKWLRIMIVSVQIRRLFDFR